MTELYLKYEYWIAFTQLLLAMFGMGATLRVVDFINVARTPRAFATGISLQLLMVPLIAVLFLAIFNLQPGVAVGIAILAAIPGGTTSNIYTHFARGNIALSIAITAVTTVACLVTVPIILKLLITDYVPADFRLPAARIAAEIFFSILGPLALGMLTLRLLPTLSAQIAKWSIRASLALIIVIILGASTSGRLDWAAFGLGNVLVVTGFTISLLAAGLVVPWLMRAPRPDIVAIDMELTVRNVNLAVLIIASLFPAANAATSTLGSMALFTVLVYGGWMLMPALVLIIASRVHKKSGDALAEGDG
ncbi:bile acid:sodium symporter family protein [Litorivivens sp.]|uniref:bile acid:sodium symporter family protein n=1 Tax=Litorivivens sp. TaxID=2020868 RepID=UPI003565025F